jgi:hypothetical protein
VNATGTGGTTATLPGGFTVETASDGLLPVTATAPGSLRAGFFGTFELTIYNTGNTDETICLIRVSGENVEMRRVGAVDYVSPTLQIDGHEPSDTPGGPPIGIVPPNSSRTLKVEFRTTSTTPHANLRMLAEVFTCEELTRGGTRPLPPPPPDLKPPVNPPPTGEIPHPAPGGSAGTTTDNRFSGDPNDIEGPGGIDNAPGGANERWIRPDGALGYAIRFENVPSASAPAALVTVSETLDDAIDLDTFELGSLGWGDVNVIVPGGLQSFHGDLPLADGDRVYVDAALDRATRTVTWRLATIDPDTGLLDTDPDAGFLPPEDGTGRGDGRVTYSARLLDAVADGASAAARARIVFDVNPPIDTPVWTNRVDREPPRSAVTSATQPGGANCKQQLNVTWSGTDVGSGSGLASYSILVAKNGGPFEAWSPGTTATAGTLPTEAGATYSFKSIARDEVGNQEALPGSSDVTVTAVDCGVAPADFGPKLLIKISLGKMKKASKAPIKVENGYSFPVTGALQLLEAKKHHGKRKPVSGSKSLAVDGGKTEQVAMKIKGASKRTLAAGKPVKVVAEVEVRNSAGQKRTLVQKLKLKVKNGNH